MKIFSFGIFYCLIYSIIKIKAVDELSLGRGFGDHINWYMLEDALLEAKSASRPIMVIIHKTWCGACKALKPKFAESKEIAYLSKNFIMVNLENDEVPEDGSYAPDGGYIPRILFLNSDGEIQLDIYNENGNPQYKYFYPDAESIAVAMKKGSLGIPLKAKPIDEL